MRPLPRFIAALLLSATAAPRAGAQKFEAYVDSVMNAAVAKHQTPGASVLVLSGGRTVLAKGYGYADLENDVRATDQTVYRIGSLTKQFTAAAIVRLAEQGKLSFDDTLQKFLPAYPMQGNRVTVRQLLTHTSGVANYTALPKWAPTMRLDVPLDSVIALFASAPFSFKPGDRYQYSNSGYFLLGNIIAKVTGKTYESYMDEDFFPSVGLKNTRYCSTAPIVKRRAQGYTPAMNGEFTNASYISMVQPYAAGALCSTVGDLGAWTLALSSGKVVSPASYTQMTTPATLNSGETHGYGFGLNIGKLEGHREISHNGGINGFVSELHHFPDDSLVIVVLTNVESVLAPALEKLIARKALDIKDKPLSKLPVPSADSARFVGEYMLGTLPLRIFAGEGGGFMAQATGQSAFAIFYEGNGLFIAGFDNTITLKFNAGTPSPSFVIVQGVPSLATRKK